MIDIGADLPAQVRLLAAGNLVATRTTPLRCTLTQDAIYFPRDRDMPRQSSREMHHRGIASCSFSFTGT